MSRGWIRAGVAACLCVAGVSSDAGSAVPLTKAEPHRFRLAPTGKAPLASGAVELLPAHSPFGLAVTADGFFTYDLELHANDLPAASTLGAYDGYVAWVATPNLELYRNLGTIRNGDALTAQVDWNKFTVFVTAERSAGARKWTGPIVLVGRSPSSLMQSFAGHPFYSTGMPPF